MTGKVIKGVKFGVLQLGSHDERQNQWGLKLCHVCLCLRKCSTIYKLCVSLLTSAWIKVGSLTTNLQVGGTENVDE